MNNPVQQQIISISHTSEVAEARRTAKTMALSIGFDENTCEEIVIVISELAANLVKHARNGTLTLTPLDENGHLGIKIESHDHGAGIPYVELAIKDGYSTIGSLGYGLGTVNRLMDEFTITSRCHENSGTDITCSRWLRTNIQPEKSCFLDVGAASRPHPRMDVNGDSFVIKRWNDCVLAGIIDGLGHGQFAHRAAESARRYIESHFDQPLEDIFRGVERSCHATRGVVMALAQFECSKNVLRYASLGNVEVRVVGSAKPMNFITRRGILGVMKAKPVVTEHTWMPNYIMILYSDGIKSHWRWDDFPGLTEKPAQIIAQKLLIELAHDNDDATVVVVKGAAQ